ncbi:MAG: nucleotide-binding protein [Candidatus Pacebacteria bacterium]|nr:nucleotide-binding protein [Candidatus Paceibacterota bacterium]
MAKYYHVTVVKKPISTNKPSNAIDHEKLQVYEIDHINTDVIIKYIITPYNNKEQINIDGQDINFNEIESLKVRSSDLMIKNISDIIHEKSELKYKIFSYHYVLFGDHEEYFTDVTREIRELARKNDENSSTVLPHSVTSPIQQIVKESNIVNNKVFIVHGRDKASKLSVVSFINKLGLEAVILHEQANKGKTIIEKIEEYTDVGFAIVIYTPCDLGKMANEPEDQVKPRARQNVVWEHGYFCAKLGRERVSALVQGDVETPSDIDGLVYIPFDDAEGWKLILAKDLTDAGYNIDLNVLLKRVT